MDESPHIVRCRIPGKPAREWRYTTPEQAERQRRCLIEMLESAGQSASVTVLSPGGGFDRHVVAGSPGTPDPRDTRGASERAAAAVAAQRAHSARQEAARLAEENGRQSIRILRVGAVMFLAGGVLLLAAMYRWHVTGPATLFWSSVGMMVLVLCAVVCFGASLPESGQRKLTGGLWVVAGLALFPIVLVAMLSGHGHVLTRVSGRRKGSSGRDGGSLDDGSGDDD